MPTNVDTPTTPAPRRPVLDRATAMRLAAAEYDRVVEALRSLSPADWTRPTDCPGWDVRALACHMLGMAEMSASMREQMRQMRKARKAGGVMIDALTGLQVSERTQMTPTQIVERFAAVGPRAARGAGGPRASCAAARCPSSPSERRPTAPWSGGPSVT